jgi:hypothetical protein
MPRDTRSLRSDDPPSGVGGRRGRATLAVALGLLAIVAVVAAVLPGFASAVERKATPATLDSVFSEAGDGDTILLAGGSYGEFTGGLKSGMVTLKPQPGASVAMNLRFSPASNITIDGVRIRDAYISDARTKNITIRNSDFDRGQIVLRGGAGDLVDANILLERNVHSNFDVCSGCYAARVQIAERTERPTGITIRDSVFYGGNGDGIQTGGNAVRILDNEFRDMHQGDAGVAHTDSIQLYGSRNTLVKGNYFHDVAVGVMCADGCDAETIEDNVFAVDGSPYAMTLLSDRGSRISHNTLLDYGICDYGQRCGVLYLGNKDGDPPSKGTILVDNVLARVCVCAGSVSGLAVNASNLLTQTAFAGSHNLLGKPAYVGGSHPTSYEGFALAAGSAGKGNASDGLDRGVRVAARGGAGAPRATSSPLAPASVRVRSRSTLRSIVRTGRLRLELRSSRAATVTLAATVRPGAAIGAARAGHSRRPIEIAAVGLRVDGTRVVARRLTRAARRVLAGSRDARVSVRMTVDAGRASVTALKIRR